MTSSLLSIAVSNKFNKGLFISLATFINNSPSEIILTKNSKNSHEAAFTL